MAKIQSINELLSLRDKVKPMLALRDESFSGNLTKRDILVCGGTGCQSAQSEKIIENLNTHIKNAGLEDNVSVSLTGCFGFCAEGPIVKIHPDDVFYVRVSPNDAEEIVKEHIINGNHIDRLLFEEPSIKEKVHRHHDMSFYKKQSRIALRNCGHINPEDINEYIATDGYVALGKCLTSLNQDDVISEIKTSALRGRGGAGFPAGVKWEATQKVKGDEKYVI